MWCSPEVDWASYTTTIGFREYDEAGKLVSDKTYQFAAAYFHDMIVTDKWYIVFDCPIKMDYFKTFIGYPFGMNSLGDTIAGACCVLCPWCQSDLLAALRGACMSLHCILSSCACWCKLRGSHDATATCGAGETPCSHLLLDLMK